MWTKKYGMEDEYKTTYSQDKKKDPYLTSNSKGHGKGSNVFIRQKIVSMVKYQNTQSTPNPKSLGLGSMSTWS